MSERPVISALDARRLLMSGCGLHESPERRCTSATLYKGIEELGFVQLDTISIVERAHNHIVWTRFAEFRPEQLDLLQRKGKLFEHFTHDASLIPSIWFPHWRHRFDRVLWSDWIHSRMKGRKEELLSHVRGRIEKEGPLLARDFEDPDHDRGAWWDWKPAKAALEYLWRRGELTIPRRDNFQKVYDLTHRVMPEAHAAPTPTIDEHIEWACSTALERLGAATSGEIRNFWRAITPAQALHWCREAVASGRAVEVQLEGVNGSRKKGYAIANFEKSLRSVRATHAEARLLSPFEPLIRDRDRLERVFGFNYRFEAFVPAPKRTHGYYVLPILRGEQLIGRLDPQLDRKKGVLSIKGLWFEEHATDDDRRSVKPAIERYAAFCGAKSVRFERRATAALP